MRLGDWEIGRGGEEEKRRRGDFEIGRRGGDFETGRLGEILKCLGKNTLD